MSILMGLAIAWLATAAAVVLTFYGSRRSRRLSNFLFGQQMTNNVHRLEPRAEREVTTPDRLAA